MKDKQPPTLRTMLSRQEFVKNALAEEPAKQLRIKSSDVQALLNTNAVIHQKNLSAHSYQEEKNYSKPRKQEEDKEQEAIFQWVRLFSHQMPELSLLFAIPNGGHRNAWIGAALKRQGVKAGVPDMMLPVSRGGYHGLFIELKKGSGGQIKNQQKLFIAAVKEQNYLAVVAYGEKEATQILKEYLEGKIKRK